MCRDTATIRQLQRLSRENCVPVVDLELRLSAAGMTHTDLRVEAGARQDVSRQPNTRELDVVVDDLAANAERMNGYTEACDFREALRSELLGIIGAVADEYDRAER